MNFVANEAFLPYFEEVASAFRAGPSIDWNYIDGIDPSDLAMTRDKDTMRQITNQFINAVSFTVQNPTRLLRLFQILQVIMKHMNDVNHKLKKALRVSMKQNEKLKERNRKLVSRKKPVGIQCPICQKIFSEMRYVDVHVFAQHPEQSAVWQALRTPYYPGMTKTYDPLSAEGAMQRLIQKMSDHYSLELRSSELDTQVYLKKKLLKMKEALTSMTPAETESVQAPAPAPAAPTIREVPVVRNQFQWKPQVEMVEKSTDDDDSSGEVHVTRARPAPESDSGNVFVLSDSPIPSEEMPGPGRVVSLSS